MHQKSPLGNPKMTLPPLTEQKNGQQSDNFCPSPSHGRKIVAQFPYTAGGCCPVLAKE